MSENDDSNSGARGKDNSFNESESCNISLSGSENKGNESDQVSSTEHSDDSEDNQLNTENKFLAPSLPLPVAKSQKKQTSKSVSMKIKSRFAIPADIYKAPKVAAFISSAPPIKKKERDAGEDSSKETIDAKPKAAPAVLNYEQPDWSSEPDDGKYSLEVLKNGSIIDTVKLCGKDHFLVGRIPICDIKMEHPSISRYHAVFQYGAPDSTANHVELQKDGSCGFYVCDLASTHGTTINKHQIRSKLFYRIKVGHVVKFGLSTRMYILQGPEDDQEQEATETATELRELNRKKIKKKKDLEKMMLGEDSSSDEDDESKKKNTQRDGENSGGVTWGMLEDAVTVSSDEEEENEEMGDTRADHPDAIIVQTKKEPFYMKDPVKAVKNLYEREKIELDFECSERRSGHWHVKLCLPVDNPAGKPVYAEVNATGKKKDTIRQCALEACRILEKHGLFHHKNRQGQRVKQWENDDFYDSGEDEFHDRTGELEMKRKMRMQRAGRKLKGGKAVETYESLLNKVTELDNEIKDIETKLEKDKAVTKVSADAVDPLDAFMQQVKSGKALDTTTRSKLKRRLLEARKEHMRVTKLADLARPSSLPPLQSSSLKSYSFVGKMKGKKKTISTISTTLPQQHAQDTKEANSATNEIEEFDEGENKTYEKTPVKTVKLLDKTSETISNKSAIIEPSEDNLAEKMTARTSAEEVAKSTSTDHSIPMDVETSNNENNSESNHSSHTSSKNTEERFLGPVVPDELRKRLSTESELPENKPLDEEAPEPKRRRKRQRHRMANRKLDPKAEQFSDDPKYSGWLPPENQSGDGKTSLNEKLGY